MNVKSLEHGQMVSEQTVKRIADDVIFWGARFEAGQIYLPKEAPWLDTFLHELLAFPNARHDDQIDSVSQFLNWAERDHFLQPTVFDLRPQNFYG